MVTSLYWQPLTNARGQNTTAERRAFRRIIHICLKTKSPHLADRHFDLFGKWGQIIWGSYGAIFHYTARVTLPERRHLVQTYT